ncbi:uncharacterized protein LOC121380093 [Gigantopelta aegis]|uniref:uncharacterized protein LOC121380093 n=1 Tax=Gigantopelta aegis TaxID=1735272 RepID=UPI001B88D4B5|nr:uncharacterized protein LOC121380093 [Gigantopelta aegis]
MLVSGCIARLLVVTTTLTCLTLVSAKYCTVAGPTDIVIGLGDSFSTMTHWWKTIVYSPGALRFVDSLIKQFDYSQVRVSLFAYSNSIRRISAFSTNRRYLSRTLLGRWIPQFGGLRTSAGLRVFTNYLLSKSRRGATRIIILLSNRPPDNYYWTISQAVRTRNKNIHIITVGCGNRNIRESVMITGKTNQVFGSINEHVLVSLVPGVKRRICRLTEESQPPPQIPPVVINRVDIILVADHSQSVRVIDGIRATYCVQCLEFIANFVDNIAFPRCAVGITMFADDAYVLSGISEEANSLRTTINSVDGLLIPYAGSSLESGIAIAHAQFSNSSRESSNKKVILVMCDGSGENDERVRSQSMAARADDIVTYVLTWPSPGGIAINDIQLNDIAGESSRIIKVTSLERLPEMAAPLAGKMCPSG